MNAKIITALLFTLIAAWCFRDQINIDIPVIEAIQVLPLCIRRFTADDNDDGN